MSFDNVDTTPSGDWSSYLMASNASLTDCFVMTTGGARPIRVDARPSRVEGGERHRGATDTNPLVNADARKMSIADGSNDDLKRSMAEYLMVCG